VVDLNNSAYSSVDGVLFNKSTNTLIQCPGAKPVSTQSPTVSSALNMWRSLTAPT
jgi:hypothetical protein